MKCPQPERLLENLAGKNGAVEKARAEAHVAGCGPCGAALDSLLAPAGPLVRFLAETAPARLEGCPEPEDLAWWSEGGPMQPGEANRIALHLSGCEACALLSAQLRLELARGSQAVGPFHPAQAQAAHIPAAVWRASLIAQIVGGLLLALFLMRVILPRLSHLALPRMVVRTEQPSVQPASSNSQEWPLRAAFEFRLRGSSETHELQFPYFAGLQLSKDYEYAVQLTAQRSGWFLLLAVGPDQRLSVPLPSGTPSSGVPRLETGQAARFPSGTAWAPVDAIPGRREFYVVYLDNSAAAQALLAESQHTEASGHGAVAWGPKLEELVAAGCASVNQPCVLKFEYEVY
jgi:hypothetical protein